MFAAGEFNQGSTATHKFLSLCGTFMGDRMRRLGRQRDELRKRKSRISLDATTIERRKKRKSAQQREEQLMERLEGGPSYKAGGF